MAENEQASIMSGKDRVVRVKGRRITVDLTAAAGSELERLRNRTGLSTAELFRHAFNLLRIYVRAKSEGKELSVSDPDGKERVIELPFLVSGSDGSM